MVHDIYHFHKGNEICYQPFVIGSNIFIFLSEATTPFTSSTSVVLSPFVLKRSVLGHTVQILDLYLVAKCAP